jgi:hypothetical protein
VTVDQAIDPYESGNNSSDDMGDGRSENGTALSGEDSAEEPAGMLDGEGSLDDRDIYRDSGKDSGMSFTTIVLS